MYHNEKYFFFFKKILPILIFTILLSSFSYSKENLLLEKLLNEKEIKITINGNNYVRYLKQIKLVGKKINLSSNSLINTSKKKWIKAKIVNNNQKIPIKIKLHGNNSDHISIPYSSLNIKNSFNKYDKLNLLRPNTRNYEAEIFGTVFLESFNIITPNTKYINFQINKTKPETFIMQEKIDDKLLKRNNLKNGPIIRFSDKEEKIYEKENKKSEKINFLEIHENLNDEFVKNSNSALIAYKSIGLVNYKKYFDNYYNYKFQTLLSILNGCHGLTGNDPIFYFDEQSTQFYHIYYDGMFFENYNDSYFCDQSRYIIKPEYKKKLILEIENKIQNQDYKKKLKKNYSKKTNNKFDNFDYFWNIFVNKFNNFKIKTETKVLTNSNKIKLTKKLEKINFFYPFVYSYSKNNKFYLCIKWPNNNKNIHLINKRKQIINRKNFDQCKKINFNKAKSILLGNLIFFYPDENIEIYPAVIGNVNNENEIY